MSNAAKTMEYSDMVRLAKELALELQSDLLKFAQHHPDPDEPDSAAPYLFSEFLLVLADSYIMRYTAVGKMIP